MQCCSCNRPMILSALTTQHTNPLPCSLSLSLSLSPCYCFFFSPFSWTTSVFAPSATATPTQLQSDLLQAPGQGPPLGWCCCCDHYYDSCHWCCRVGCHRWRPLSCQDWPAGRTWNSIPNLHLRAKSKKKTHKHGHRRQSGWWGEWGDQFRWSRYTQTHAYVIR
jgi:hypothetical protein